MAILRICELYSMIFCRTLHFFLIYGILSCILGMSFTPYSKYVIQSKIDFWHCLNHLDSTIFTNIVRFSAFTKLFLAAQTCEKKCAFKGQLISKRPFGIIVWTKIPTKLFLHFCPEFFCSFLGASWKLFGLPGYLVFNIINKEAYRKPQKASMKPPGRYKNFQGRNPEIISLVFLSKQ